MKKFTLVTFFAFSLLANVSGYNTFERTYVNINSESGNCVRQTSDGGFIIASVLEFSKIYLLRTNQNGDTLWTKTYNGVCHDVQEDQDGNFILCGEINNNALLMKVNAEGTVIWTHNYGGIGHEVANSFVQTTDKQIIFCGYSESSTYYVKTDSIGILVWEKYYNGLYTSYGSVIRSAGNDFMICGNGGDINKMDLNNIILIKINSDGDTLWTRKIFGVAYANSFAFADDGILTCGFGPMGSGTTIELEKTDLNGIHVWSKILTIGNEFSVANWMERTSDGDYILTGNYGNSLLILKVDANGDTLWTRKYNNSTIAKGNFIQTCSNGGFVACGSSGTSATSFNVYLIRTDDAGLITGTEDKECSKPLINVYPNPFNHELHISIPGHSSHIFTFELADMTGKVVCTGKTANGVIPTDQLETGSYVLRVEERGTVILRKTVVKR